MKDEIKEILESLDKIAKGSYYPEDLLYYENCKQLLDYITNLQEKYNGIKSNFDIQLEYDEELENKITNLQEETKKLQDRNIELVLERDRLKEELQQEKKDFKEANDYCFELKDYKSRNKKAIEYIQDSNILAIYKLDYFIEDLLNILTGGDKDE